MYPDYDTPRLTGPYLEISSAREQQRTRLGTEQHSLQEWVLALVEGVGEIAQAVLDATREEDGQLGTVREETVRTGAGIVALLEYIDGLEAAAT
jgi:hypothetical protein